MNFLDGQNSKNQKFVIDKIFHPLDVHFDTNSLSTRVGQYREKGLYDNPETSICSEKKIFKTRTEAEFYYDKMDRDKSTN